MKKLTLISFILIFFSGCIQRERVLPKYKGWVVIDKNLNGWVDDDFAYHYDDAHVTLTLQNNNDIKTIKLYSIDTKYKVGDTIK